MAPFTKPCRTAFRPLLSALAVIALAATGVAAPAEPFHFHHENILGTSLDLQVAAADETQAAAVEAAVLGEIERLRKILSTYDPASEISRLNTSTGPMVCSPELLDVLASYDGWTLRSRGAYNDRLELVFKSPGRRTEAGIDRPDGHATVSVETHGFAGRFVELHRGTDAGPAWRLVIDISAVLLLISGATGLTLWLIVPKWRPLGLAALAVCLGVGAVVYFALVP